ncbi:MAG TPA: STAS domain-containing protein [bacterium]|nr:STAS domain-containing protein [bacterium]
MESLATIDVRQHDGVSLVRICGEIDTSNVSDVGEALATAAPSNGLGLIVDLSGVTYLNSAMIKSLFDLAEQLRQRQQRLGLVMDEGAPMRKLLLLLKLDLVVPLDHTNDDAVARIKGARAGGG